MKKNNNEKIICPVCNETIIKKYFDICKVCGWVHDLVQLDDMDFENGPNNLSLVQSREYFKLKRIQNPNYMWNNKSEKIGNPSKDDLEKLRAEVESKK
jgi:rubredoxin